MAARCRHKTPGDAGQTTCAGFQETSPVIAQSGETIPPPGTKDETSTRPQGSRLEKRCFRCGQIRYLRRDCPKQAIVCFNCGGEGHISIMCDQRARRYEMEQGGRWRALGLFTMQTVCVIVSQEVMNKRKQFPLGKHFEPLCNKYQTTVAFWILKKHDKCVVTKEEEFPYYIKDIKVSFCSE